jgi:two-component system chemotaxis response regulator CheY
VHAIVIDDSSAMRMILRRTLTRLDFEVTEAVNGRDALDRLATLDPLPDVALVDWNMPEMDGLTFVQTVREDPRYRQLTLLMVTTESEQSQIVRALAAGAHEYLIKPFTPDAVAEKLELLGLTTAGVM